jgi:hypothetical protein
MSKTLPAASPLPRKSFARKIISMMGYSRDDAIIEIASIDKCSSEEAGQRYDLAIKQSVRRSMAQTKRHADAKLAVELARDLVLILARNNDLFACPKDLLVVSQRAGWGYSESFTSSGRVYREFVLPFKREGMLTEKRDEDGKLVGYTITDAGLTFLKNL